MRSTLEKNIIQWAHERKLVNPDNAKNQALKTVEEMGELASALLKNDREKIKDAIGDVEVCLTILKEQLEFAQNTPLIFAWDEIKDREGKTVNGTFIKG